jgi:hypothetical protein
MSGALDQAESTTDSEDSVTTTLGNVLREFNRKAEDVLRGLREYPSHLAPHHKIGFLRGDEQLRELRAAMPRRVLALGEGLQIAERQAALLRWQLGAEVTPVLATEVLANMPFLTVTYKARLAKSGLATKTARGWVIVLRADEPNVRQRFSLGHEIKHTLDDELLSLSPRACTAHGAASAARRQPSGSATTSQPAC